MPASKSYGFAVYCKGNVEAKNAHFHACKASARPMVTVEVGPQYSKVEWDCITTNTPSDDLVDVMFKRFQSRSNSHGRARFSGSAFVGSIESLEPATARALASDYLELLR